MEGQQLAALTIGQIMVFVNGYFAWRFATKPDRVRKPYSFGKKDGW